MKWTPDTIKKLKVYWLARDNPITKDGRWPTSQIGELMGVSKNTICGAVRRYGLPPRKTGPSRKDPIAYKGATERLRRKMGVNQTEGAKPLSELARGECRYPVGGSKPRDHIFCADNISKGSYCDLHYGIVYKKEKSRGRVK